MTKRSPRVIYWKYLFIGSGPATLTAVLSLPPGDQRRTVVLEAGNEIRAVCPELKSKSCSSCDGELCHVVNGIGGSSAMFGNKLCHFPASASVLDSCKDRDSLSRVLESECVHNRNCAAT